MTPARQTTFSFFLSNSVTSPATNKTFFSLSLMPVQVLYKYCTAYKHVLRSSLLILYLTGLKFRLTIHDQNSYGVPIVRRTTVFQTSPNDACQTNDIVFLSVTFHTSLYKVRVGPTTFQTIILSIYSISPL
jgi:hypothetical protein